MLRDASLGLLGLLAGAGLFAAGRTIVGTDDDGAAADTIALDLVPPATGPGADSPEAAVAAFLDAELADDSEAAFSLLSGADRADYPTPNTWAARRGSVLGDVEAWQWDGDSKNSTLLTLVPGLSETAGWTPASRSVDWVLVDEDGWRVALAESTGTPSLPDESTVVEAANDWLTNDERCSRRDLDLRPPSAAFEGLCEVGGVVESDDSVPVAGAIAAELSSAYGADASSWARQVSLEGGLDLIVAAVGDEWLVIDAVERY